MRMLSTSASHQLSTQSYLIKKDERTHMKKSHEIPKKIEFTLKLLKGFVKLTSSSVLVSMKKWIKRRSHGKENFQINESERESRERRRNEREVSGHMFRKKWNSDIGALPTLRQRPPTDKTPLPRVLIDDLQEYDLIIKFIPTFDFTLKNKFFNFSSENQFT